MTRIGIFITCIISLCITCAQASDQWTRYLGWCRDTNYYPYSSELSWTLDESDLTSDVDLVDALYAVNQAFAAWDAVPNTTYSFLYKSDLGEAYDQLDNGTNWNFWYANIVVGGWLDATTWAQAGGGTNNISGAWPFTVRDNQGNYVDYDSNGYDDLAQVVIFFNDSYTWGTDGDPNKYDIQTVMMHEIGHALGLHHSPDGVDSVMVGITDPGEIQHTLYDWDQQQVQNIYPVAVPEPSAMLLFLLGFLLKPFIKKRSS